MSYEPVKKAMQAGTPLELICTACPWDRLCITPPTMTAADVDEQIAKAKQEDEERRTGPDGGKGFPLASLMTLAIVGGKDMTAQLCPVFVTRLRSPDGRIIADTIRNSMQRFGESGGEPR